MTASILTLIILTYISRHYPKTRINIFTKKGLRNTAIAGLHHLPRTLRPRTVGAHLLTRTPRDGPGTPQGNLGSLMASPGPWPEPQTSRPLQKARHTTAQPVCSYSAKMLSMRLALSRE